ncbi:MAG: zinc-dependent alcohol dehydrogenase [Actinomycetota bacterium]
MDEPEPVAADGEAIVRVRACGLCGSDRSCYATGVFAPVVLGHEIAGELEADAGELRAGELVVVDPKIPCGRCTDCKNDAEHRCVESLTRGIGAGRSGGFAERVAVPESCLHRVPAGLETHVACLAEPLSCVLHGLDRVEMRAGEDAIVIGLGPIGLLTVVALRARGASRIVGIDPLPARRALALALGADEAVEPGMLHDQTSLVVEASGTAAAMRIAGNLAVAGGRVLLIGVPMDEVMMTPLVWVSREVSLVGSIASKHSDVDRALAMLVQKPSLAAIVTDRIPLEAVPAAMAEPPIGGKIVVVP